MEPLCVHIKNIYPTNTITEVVMFKTNFNVKLGGELLKFYNPKLMVLRGVEHPVSLFFNNYSKIPIVNKMIISHKYIYKLFGSDIYHKPHYTFKPKSHRLHNSNIVIFSGIYNIMKIGGGEFSFPHHGPNQLHACTSQA